MAADDFEVVAYKVLSYLYSCIKAGVEPNVAKAKDIAGVNDVYWSAVVRSIESDGLAEVDWFSHWAGREVDGLCITGKGAAYLKDNSRMQAVRRFLGEAFNAVLTTAVEATMAMALR